MRQTIIFLTFTVAIIACTNSDTKTSADDTNGHQIGTTKTSRHILIEELKKLRQTITSNDKEKIADIFGFPLPDSVFSVYVNDSSFNDQFKLNGDKTTRSMFLQHFKEISVSLWLDPMTKLFQTMPLDSLLYRDMLERDAYIKSEPCYFSYEIEVIKDSVVLKMIMNSNRSFESKNTSEGEIPENSSEICEHAFWWNFKFDGKKLRYKGNGGAG